MPKVVFQIEGANPLEIACSMGDNLLELARRGNVAVDAPCSGNGSCGKCRMKLVEGELETLPSRHITPEEFEAGWRLSCDCKVIGDCTVFVPALAAAFQNRIKTADLSSPEEFAIFTDCQKQLKASGVVFSNQFRFAVLKMAEPIPDDTMFDDERLTNAIREALGVARVQIPVEVMVHLAEVLRANHFQVCVKGELHGDSFLCMELAPPEDTKLVGCAIDIGTTTVTAVLVDLSTGSVLAKGSCGNGQIRYGADVIHRIIQQGKPGGRERLQDAIVKETLNPLLANLCRSVRLSKENLLRVCVAANTTMNHLLLGVDAAPIRIEPYIPSFLTWEGLTAGELKLSANPLARVQIAPNVGSYVGGDITAGTLAAGLWNRDEMNLLVDLGTNGEIVFGNRDFLISCACSAGPAFEGGDIACGMRATDGAIETCEIDEITMEPTFAVVGNAGQKPVGICGSGIIDVVSELFRCGIINAKGSFVREGSRVLRDAFGMGRFLLVAAEDSETGREIFLSEVDIDNFIRAKGAVFSAIDTLLKTVDMTVDCIDQVYIAGGIGSGINIKNAISVGMLPAVALDRYQYIGNSSLAGACAMVMSDQAEKKCAEVAGNMTYLELSAHPSYMDAFVAACFLPHTDARLFPNSKKSV